MDKDLIFWVPPPRISERAILMSLGQWENRRATHQQLQRCECSVTCKRGDQYIGIKLKELK